MIMGCLSFCLNLLFSFQCFEVERDFSLIGVVVVFVADLFGDHSALDLSVFLSDQAEPNSHQRVDIGRLKKRRKEAKQTLDFFIFSLGHCVILIFNGRILVILII